jgi:hypothetical protein
MMIVSEYTWLSISGNPPPFNNSEFILTFSQIFLSFTVSEDPNNKINNASALIPWSQWAESHTELVFNITADGEQVDLSTTTTDEALLERCR